MAHVRRLLSAALVAGAISGLGAFGVQHIMVEPLLLKAEIYEDAARRTQAEGAHAGHEWKPSDGFERTAFTCLSTVLTGVGYAALSSDWPRRWTCGSISRGARSPVLPLSRVCRSRLPSDYHRSCRARLWRICRHVSCGG